MTEKLSYSLREAAERLGSIFTEDWLRNHLREIPHLRDGKGTGRAGRIGFTEAHLQQILLMYEVTPAPRVEPGDFTPLTRRRAHRTQTPVPSTTQDATTAPDTTRRTA